LPFEVQPTLTPDAPTVDIVLRVTAAELVALRAWADERVQIEFERAQELQALDRCFDHRAWVASFALQVSSVFETQPVPA
jgi:hypothetical protein